VRSPEHSPVVKHAIDRGSTRRDALDRVYVKVMWRILPFLFICYVVAYLDRVNIGFAKLQMQQELAISEADYGLAAGIFFLGYLLFEIPSNLLLTKIGARKTFSRILVLWGATSASTMFVRDASSSVSSVSCLGSLKRALALGYCSISPFGTRPHA
jgi:sugar phosphate permease